MALAVTRYGTMREGGGCLFVVNGAPANRRIQWTLTGNGSLTPVTDYTDEHGVAMAVWDATGASQGDSVNVDAEYHS